MNKPKHTLTPDGHKSIAMLRAERDELLEALENLTHAWSDYTSQETYGEHLRAGLAKEDFSRWAEYHDIARAAIAKAKGE